ncbi:glycosyltransferase [Bacillus aquiflavi]|uniref:Glycosyltransferase n=1 Tax=Bacillus aquiflavi TaxID=2672567 RepID=A0A6B3W4G3_9BACI|nr:glycosyltransferase [Bacillus aquiflavi]MBA4538055.1 glycosyltransferase [Bacillus aquiflavi]NEY82354.1 glycosyltransferase family 4 protein [Bacillus aquiflavi]UAC47865.1 glycosyltransferase [Bacillus aquiflavi]
MKVLIIPSWYSTDDNPINGIFFKEQAVALSEHQLDIRVAFPELISMKKFSKFGLHKLGYRVETKPVFTGRNIQYLYFPFNIAYSYGYFFRKYLLKIMEKFEKEGWIPDIIHAHSALWGGWAAISLKGKYSVPLIITEHFSGFITGKLNKTQLSAAKIAFEHSDKIIAVGPTLQEKLSELVDSNKITLIPNIVDVENFTVEERKRESSHFTFLSIGFLKYNKRMDLLIKAFHQAFSNQKHMLLNIIGDGEQYSQLKQLIDDLNMNDQIKLLGRKSREDVKVYLNSCDAFVLASEFETFGVSFIEALACGKPIIATDSGGPSMIVNESNGFLVPKNNEQELANAMKKLTENYHSYHPSVIRNNCEQKFGKETITKQIISEYKMQLES